LIWGCGEGNGGNGPGPAGEDGSPPPGIDGSGPPPGTDGGPPPSSDGSIPPKDKGPPPKPPGKSFATKSTSWFVPVPGAEVQDGFYATARVGYGKYWATVDLDGDERPDLVWTGDKDAAVWGNAAGSPHWKVFKNSGGAFASTAKSWTVPDPGAEVAKGFYTTAYSGYGKYWALVDLDGDDRPDLVWTGDKDAKVWGNGSSPHWKLFRNNGGGFDTKAKIWPVPDPGAEVQKGFHATAYSGYGKYWSLVDLDGDDRPDLVWTGDKDAKVWGNAAGSPHWRVFKNTGSGFAKQAQSWPVPDPGAEVTNGFYATDRSGYEKYWSLLDLTGDDRPDLVWTGNKDAKVWGLGSSSGPYWKLYKSYGGGFEEKPATWPVPDPGGEVQNGFYATARVGYGKYWTTFDLDGDDKLDLVWTGDKDAKVWGSGSSSGSHWKLFKGTGSGFAKQHATWAVPDPGATYTKGFYTTAYSGYGKYWSTFDLDGDRRPDLVWTGDKDAKVWGVTTATPHWGLFKNQ
jgi:uncharacterized protein YpmB